MRTPEQSTRFSRLRERQSTCPVSRKKSRREKPQIGGRMSFEDRVNRRLELWLARHPGVAADDIKRKRKSIARRLNDDEAERQDRQK